MLAKMEGVSADALAKVKSALDTANADLAEHKTQLEQIRALKYDEEINKQGDALRGSVPLLENLNRAYGQNEEAIRQAQVQLQLYSWELAHPGASAEQIAAVTAQIEKQSETSRDAQLAQEAGQFSISKQYDDQVAKLERVREVMQANGQSTILIDAKIKDAQDNLLHQWDEAAFKVGTFSHKFGAVMNEVAIQGRQAGAAIASAFVTAIDGIETQFAKLLTGQKTNFKGVFQGLAEQVTKAQIQKGVGSIAEHFGIHLPGLGQKADGSDANPFYVILKASAGANGSPGKLDLSTLFNLGSTDAGKNNPFQGFGIGSDANPNQHSNVGGFFSSMLNNFFGGHMAEGGDMTPGKWYIAGERGPEPILAGRSGGTVFPSGGRGGGGNSYHQTFNYNHSADRDLFGRTDKQNAAKHMRNMRLAHS